MTSFGRYETVRELHHSGFTVLYSGRAAADPAEKFAIKVFQPSTLLLETEQIKTESELFLNSAQVQQKTAASGAQYWAPIYECGSIPDGAFYVTDKYDHSLQQLIDVRVALTAQALREIVESVAKGLVELKQACGRPHGNLKATNILIAGEGDISQTTIVLSDPLPDEHIDTEVHWDSDLREIAEFIYQLVMHRPSPAVDGWQVPDSKEWARLGKLAKDWRNLCNRLLNASLMPGMVTIETLIEELARLKKIKPVFSSRRLLIAIGLVVIAGAAILGIKPDIWKIIFPPEPPTIKEWNQLLIEYVGWVETLRNDLGGRKSNPREKRWKNKPHLRIIVEKIKKEASYPYFVEDDLSDLVKNLNKFETKEDLSNNGIVEDKTWAALKAIEIIKCFFDPKSDPKTDPNSYTFYDSNSQKDRKEYQTWPVLVETQQITNSFGERGWQRPATYLQNLVDDIKPEPNKPIAENVDNILELQDSLVDIETRWAEIEKNQKIIESIGDPNLVKFPDNIQSQLVSADLDTLGLELDQVSTLTGELAKFIEDNVQRIDKTTFLNDHRNEEILTNKTFSERLEIIKDYLYLVPDPRVELSKLENLIKDYMPLARASNPLEAGKCVVEFERLQPNLETIRNIKGIEKNRRDITEVVNNFKPELEKLEERVVAATESPEKFHQRIGEMNVLSTEASEEINKKWLRSRDNLLDSYPLPQLKENLGEYAELRRKIDDTIRNLEKLDETFQTELPSQLEVEVKESEWNNQLKLFYDQERKETIKLVVENIPLQDEILQINAPSFEQFSRTQYSEFQQLRLDLSGILAAFNNIEDGLDACYILDQKLTESEQTVRLLWARWKDTEILKQPRINEAIAKLTKRLKDLEEIEKSDDRDALGTMATDQNSQTEAGYAAWTRLGELTALPWPDTDQEWKREKEIQEVLREKFSAITIENRAIELGSTLDEGSLHREKVFRGAKIRRSKTIVKSKSFADSVLIKFETLEPYDADADLSEIVDFENIAKALADFVTDPNWNWPKQFSTDLFSNESSIYQKASLTKEDFQEWMEKVKDYSKLENDPRNSYTWAEKIDKIEGLIGKELARKQAVEFLRNIQNLKSDFDTVKSTINDMRLLPAIEKNRVEIDKYKDHWQKLVEIESKLKPDYCKRMDLKDERIIFNADSLNPNLFEPVNVDSKVPATLAAGWEDIRQGIKDNQKKWLDFFYTRDVSDTKNVGWPKYIRSKEDPSVVLRFIKADSDNLEPFYMATYEATNAQYRLFLEKISAKKPNTVGIDTLFKDQSDNVLIRSPSLIYEDPVRAIKIGWDDKRFNITQGSDDVPVTWVTYVGAQSYAKWLGGQLPTASQHQYSCRADTDNIHPWGNNLSEITIYAHVRGGHWITAGDDYNKTIVNAEINTKDLGGLIGIAPAPMGAKPENFIPQTTRLVLTEVVHQEKTYSVWPVEHADKTNAWGLYDMIGNVWEWCQDGTRSVICGSSCLAPPEYVTDPSNYSVEFNKTACDVGFRVVVPAR